MTTRHDTPIWRATFSGLCATLVGIGLARFAYTPLIPELISAKWFAASAVVYLGAANLAGYLAGALLAQRIAARAVPANALRTMMVLATAAFFACAFPLSFAWYFCWRFAAGLAGGVLMVVAAPLVLRHVPASRRGLAGGVIFTGVGLGIAASATVVPLLLRIGLVETWYGLGALSLALTIAAWGGWPREQIDASPAPVIDRARARHGNWPLLALYLEYAFNAAGQVPHMVFLVDFIARGLGRGLEAGARDWVVFGLAAIAGPTLTGRLADRIGFKAALRLLFLVQALVIGWLAFAPESIALVVSSIVVGAMIPGFVPLALGRVHELVPDAAGRGAAWRTATTAFAIGQATAAYGYSYLFDQSGSYVVLFWLATAALAIALAIDVAVAPIGTRPDAP